MLHVRSSPVISFSGLGSCLAAWLMLGIPPAVSAQTTVPRVPLSVLIDEALANNPAIKAAERRYDAARQRPVQERSLPDPTISAGYNANGNPLPGAGLGREPTANIGFMVNQELPYPGKRDLRASMAALGADAERPQIDAARLDVIARVKQAYYRLAYTYAAADVLTRNRDLLETLLKVSEGRYGVGQAAQQDVIKAQTQLSLLELQLERLYRERSTREGDLDALLDRPGTSLVGRPDELQLTTFDVSLEMLLASAADHAPMLHRDQALVERSQVAVEAARREYKPDFTLSGGYYYMGAMRPMYEIRIDVKVPLQRARRAAAVAEQLDLVEQARSDYASTRLDLQDRVQEAYRMASTSVRLAHLYRETVLPQARLALESSLASYQTGAVDFLSVLTNFGTVLDDEMTYFDELASYHIAAGRLESLIGLPITH